MVGWRVRNGNSASVFTCMQVGEGFSGEELSGWVMGGREGIPHRFAR